MTAENTEPNDASGGDDLRARYLPVSRKELRRQREDELAKKRPGRRRPPKPALDTAAVPAPVSAHDGGPHEESPREDLGSRTEDQPSTLVDAGAQERSGAVADVEVDSTTELTPEADQAADQDADQDSGADRDASAAPAFTTGSESTSGPSSSSVPAASWEFSLPAPSASDATAVSAPVAAADAELSDSQEAAEAEFFGSEESDTPEDRAETDWSEAELKAEAETDADGDSAPEASEEAAVEAEEEDSKATEPSEEGDDVRTDLADSPVVDPLSELPSSRPQDLPGTELDDQDEAPVPASRKSRRSLEVTENIAALSEDKLAELQELTQALAATDDPNRVDPELLKKQQALAARAMQANQERLRKEQVEADRDAKERRRRLRPESEVITRKTLRAHMESDEPAEPTDHPTGSIEPIHARGAHGLEIDAMVEHSTRQGARQSMMGWLVIILAVLLIVALGVVLSFIL